MPVQVRVKDFQSIKDATVTIDGLTVVTGANNSGKTAFMRAIRGVFTNAPPGPLVRHGCAHLSVTLTFDDGTTILWEKGWEKPGRKGKTVNRYTINGKQIATVGRGVPPEVEALGVREIQAASDRVWPQIAQQFDGTLFLVNRPGSAVAEALSDVERVGALSTALKASEKDRRAVNAELKVRRKDVETHKVAAEKYDGLDVVGDQIRRLSGDLKSIQQKEQDIQDTTRCRDQRAAAAQAVNDLADFDVVIPTTKATKIKQGIVKVQGYADRLREARDEHQIWGSVSVTLPSADGVNATRAGIDVVNTLWERFNAARDAVEAADADAKRVAAELVEAEAEVQRLLGERGVCPTCNTIYEGAHP